MSDKLKSMVNAALGSLGYAVVRSESAGRALPVDFDQADVSLYSQVQPYTLTSPERVYALSRAVQYVAQQDVPGAIVECGVWKGGSMMAVALTLAAMGKPDRDLYLFDTFEGMPAPTDRDVSVDGKAAMVDFERTKISPQSSLWCNAPVEGVRRVLEETGYSPHRLHLIKGRVEETIPAHAPETIALLRLDTDWYESTRHELEHLFPRLTRGGVIIIDDYGHWQGARRATDEYLSAHGIGLLLNRIDYTARIGVKL
jgi:O-methyltransferase